MKRCEMIRNAVVLLCTLGPGSVQADVILVPEDQPTIQAAIIRAQDGDEIVLADVTHTGDGNKNLFFAGKSLTIRSAGGDREACRIDCEGEGRFANVSFGNTGRYTTSCSESSAVEPGEGQLEGVHQ